MGFYTTSKIISQSLFYFFILGEGGPRGHKHNLYVYATLLYFTLWDIMLLLV